MSRFTFRLQRVLELRETAEQQQAAILGEASMAEEARRQDSDRVARELESAHDQVGSATNGATTAAGMFRVLGLSIEAARLRALAADEALAAAEAKRLEELDRFAEARTARRAIEKLKERQAAEWAVDAARKEQQTMDEIALRRNAGREEQG